MFVLQDKKLYVEHGDGLIGVEIYPMEVLHVEGTETKLKSDHTKFTAYEIFRKYNILESPYIFPREKVLKKAVDENEPTTKTKKPTKQSK